MFGFPKVIFDSALLPMLPFALDHQIPPLDNVTKTFTTFLPFDENYAVSLTKPTSHVIVKMITMLNLRKKVSL